MEIFNTSIYHLTKSLQWERVVHDFNLTSVWRQDWSPTQAHWQLRVFNQEPRKSENVNLTVDIVNLWQPYYKWRMCIWRICLPALLYIEFSRLWFIHTLIFDEVDFFPRLWTLLVSQCGVILGMKSIQLKIKQLLESLYCYSCLISKNLAFNALMIYFSLFDYNYWKFSKSQHGVNCFLYCR